MPLHRNWVEYDKSSPISDVIRSVHAASIKLALLQAFCYPAACCNAGSQTPRGKPPYRRTLLVISKGSKSHHLAYWPAHIHLEISSAPPVVELTKNGCGLGLVQRQYIVP